MDEKPYRAKEALDFVLRNFQFQTVLDVGSGPGDHARVFRAAGKSVTTIDVQPANNPDLIGLWPSDVTVHHKYDLFWASHILEHQLNVGQFLQAMVNVTHSNSIIAITVPPLKHEIVGGHYTVWNAGLLLYNMVMNGYDCRRASVKKYGYNISLVMQRRMITRTQLSLNLHYDRGDIEKLAHYFPMKVEQGFNGDFEKVNW